MDGNNFLFVWNNESFCLKHDHTMALHHLQVYIVYAYKSALGWETFLTLSLRWRCLA